MQIQVARALGAEVATTVQRAAKARFAKRLGAQLVINTREDDFVAKVRDWAGGSGADVVIDNLGGQVLPKSSEAVKPLGVVVVFGFTAGPETTFDVRNLFFAQKQQRGAMASDIEDLEWGLEQVKAGKIEPLLDAALPLSQAGAAHKLLAESRVKGNLVLLPWAACDFCSGTAPGWDGSDENRRPSHRVLAQGSLRSSRRPLSARRNVRN